MNDRYLPVVLPGSAELEYRNSCAGDELALRLEERRVEDQQRGFTGHGPHRADIRFNFSQLDVARHLSRGQIKLFGSALISSQVEQMKQQGLAAIVLVDDIDAELDAQSSQKIMQLLLNNAAQTFVSSLALPDWVPEEVGQHAVFHVEQGSVQKR